VSVALLTIVVFVVAALAAHFWSRREPPEQTPPAQVGAAGPAPPGDTPVPMGDTAKPPAPAIAQPVSLPASPGGVTGCVVPLFPPDSFDAASDFSFVCSEADPLKGGAVIRTQLVRAHHHVSEGMKEWALLGWYEMSAFSVIQAHCCPSAAPLRLPEVPGCEPLQETFAGITTAVGATSDPSDKTLKRAVDAYTTNIHCIVRRGMATRFGRVGNPQGGEDTTFMRLLGRVVTAKR
jgi:hypothetical protein